MFRLGKEAHDWGWGEGDKWCPISALMCKSSHPVKLGLSSLLIHPLPSFLPVLILEAYRGVHCSTSIVSIPGAQTYSGSASTLLLPLVPPLSWSMRNCWFASAPSISKSSTSTLEVWWRNLLVMCVQWTSKALPPLALPTL